jgi:hypothetical protein
MPWNAGIHRCLNRSQQQPNIMCWRSTHRRKISFFSFKKIFIIAPQAFSGFLGRYTAECGQRVNECGQVLGNALSVLHQLVHTVRRTFTLCPYAFRYCPNLSQVQCLNTPECIVLETMFMKRV